MSNKGSSDLRVLLSTLVISGLVAGLAYWQLSQRWTPSPAQNGETTSNWQKIALAMTLRGQQDEVNAIALSPDGNLLVSGGDDRRLYFWNLATGTALGQATGHTDWIYALVITPDGQTVISGSKDKTINYGVWAIASSKPPSVVIKILSMV